MGRIQSQIGSSTTVILIACFVVILIGLSGAMALMRNTGQDKDNALQDASISNYEECVKAGNPIRETSPETCATPSGKTFTNTGNSRKQF